MTHLEYIHIVLINCARTHFTLFGANGNWPPRASCTFVRKHTSANHSGTPARQGYRCRRPNSVCRNRDAGSTDHGLHLRQPNRYRQRLRESLIRVGFPDSLLRCPVASERVQHLDHNRPNWASHKPTPLRSSARMADNLGRSTRHRHISNIASRRSDADSRVPDRLGRCQRCMLLPVYSVQHWQPQQLQGRRRPTCIQKL